MTVSSKKLFVMCWLRSFTVKQCIYFYLGAFILHKLIHFAPNEVSKGFVGWWHYEIIVDLWGGKNLDMFVFLYGFVSGNVKNNDSLTQKFF